MRHAYLFIIDVGPTRQDVIDAGTVEDLRKHDRQGKFADIVCHAFNEIVCKPDGQHEHVRKVSG